jgi:hypothetical protein
MASSTHYHTAAAIDFRYRGIPLHTAVDVATPGAGLLNYSTHHTLSPLGVRKISYLRT